jgi:hypothetical protein
MCFLIPKHSKRVSGGIAKAFGLDDGPTHTKAAIAKGAALDDATQIGYLRINSPWP